MQDRFDVNKRNQLLLDDNVWLARPLVLAGEHTPRSVQAHTRHLALMLLDTAVKDRASRAAAFASDMLETAMGEQVTQPVACGKGCSHCCTTYVSTTLPEVLRLARAVRGQEVTRARVADAARRARGTPQGQREVQRIICPILEDHACSAYLDRPGVCRSVLSISLDTCLRIFQNGSSEAFAFPDRLTNVRAFALIILRSALVIAGLPHRNYELTHALDIALDHEDAEERWLAGEPMFAAVAIDQGDQGAPLTGLVNALVRAVQPTI